jgi:hypothetical protein
VQGDEQPEMGGLPVIGKKVRRKQNLPFKEPNGSYVQSLTSKSA